jgi:bacteriocin biosynthesis cyclodehydratase domain-containing protein
MWTSARFAGFEFHIGPTVIPGETPCYECFRLRINSNVPDYSEHMLLEEYRKHHRLREATLAFTPAAGLLALEVLKGVTWFAAPATYAHLYVLNLLTMQSELHPILKIPRCPTCGRPAMPRPTIHAWQQTQKDPLS